MYYFKYITLLSLISLSFSQDDFIDSQRPEICERNQQTCSIVCSNVSSSDKVNTCDPDTFQFSCICDNNFTIGKNNLTMPASYAACQIEGKKCLDDCGDNNSCAQGCVLKYNCNVDDTIQSKTTKKSTSSTSTTSTSTSTKEPSIYNSNANQLALNLKELTVATLILIGGLGFANI